MRWFRKRPPWNVKTYTPEDAAYNTTPFFCGTCEEPVDFMVGYQPIALATYVHRGDHRQHCYGADSGPDTISELLLLYGPQKSRRAEP